MNLNLKAKEQYTFDAIVVGSGITGGWAAKELCEKGLKVLMLERGRPLDHPDYPNATKDPWELECAGRLTEADRLKNPIQSRHWSYRGDNKELYINDQENPYQEISRFDWIRGDIVGGRSVLWSRLCFRFSDADFEANAKDGVGVDWPVRYKDISPWYDYVENFIGVSGQHEGIPQLPDGIFQPPMEMNCVELDFKAKLKKAFPDRCVTISRVANLTQPVKGRGQCQYRNLCHRGCPYGAYFSTNASTLPAAFETGNLTLRPHSLANRILYDEQSGRATGIELIDTQTNEVIEYHARILFLNASTLATALLLLNSTSSRFPNGFGNGSDQVGRNIMDHPKGAGANAMVEGFDDRYYYGRRPAGIYVPRFINLKKRTTDYLRGFGYQGGASRESWGGHLMKDAIGAELKSAVQTPGPWRMSLDGFAECLPCQENRVTLNTELKDKWGRNTLSVDVKYRENEVTMHKHMAEMAAEMLQAVGYRDVRPFQNLSYPGNTNHEMGSARMGIDPKTSVLNGFNQMHEVKNVFITDGSFMASSGCVNPSLTYMAFTARAANYAVSELKKGNL